MTDSIRREKFRYDRKHPVHIVFFKKSKHADRLEDLAKMVKDMRGNGEFIRITGNFHQWFDAE